MHYDAGNAKPYQREEAPLGFNHFVIVSTKEGLTRDSQLPKVDVLAAVDDDDLNKSVFHTVTFFAPDNKAAGMTLHFLKCIQEPFSGEFETRPAEWVGKRFYAEIRIDPSGRKKVWAIYPPTDGVVKSSKVRPKAPKEEVPF